MAPAVVHGAPEADRGYLVQPGDYLFGIAREHDVAIGDLLAANGLTLASVIPGQRLVIPARVEPPASTASTALAIARRESRYVSGAQRVTIDLRTRLRFGRRRVPQSGCARSQSCIWVPTVSISRLSTPRSWIDLARQRANVA
jgi:LysM repeat protein